MEPLARHNSPSMDANGCRNAHGSSRPNIAGNEEVPVRTRRGGRRAQRRVTQQLTAPTTTTTTTTATTMGTTSKSMGTVVVPVHGEAATPSGDSRPVKRTAVRRRAKPTNITVTRVVTDVSLEALRAKRNGTAADISPGGDAQTIEEVSRILLMYASRHPHGSKVNFNGRLGSFPTDASAYNARLERSDRVDEAEGGTLVTAADALEKSIGTLVREQLPNVSGEFPGTSDVHAYVMSLVHSGKLAPESLEVLHAMLSHTSRGGRLDSFTAPRRGRHGNPKLGLPPTMKDALQTMSHAFATDFDCHSEQQQHELIESTEECFFGYGSYASYKDPSYMQGISCAQANGIPLHHPAGQHSVTTDCECSGERLVPYRFPSEYATQDEQALQLYTHPVAGDGVAGYEGYAHFLGPSGGYEVNSSKREGTNRKNYGADDDDDDDADVTAMLQDIRDLAQQASSPRHLGGVNSASATAAEAWNGCCDEHPDDARLSPSLPAPCVTISQTERDSLRSFQQAFIARMRVTGSPEWRSPGATSPTNLLCALAGDSDTNRFAAGQQLQQAQQQQLPLSLPQHQEQDGAGDGRYATNRTLFSYRTAF
ncbi:hypothetical protein TraAM80_07821 [Trypanosoma rangeli]|uniref:Uncharacterized protein n=1 Tax=Trypanosoma rangeli TaxID=5698 RepID=A0A422N3L9_TRYRA|nr:uncharacterized protein TraAM80_07821 [Trypanosoma rangeli]RNF00079.1 hypothetical protein TraAM80_07821 [Trypanosoma rangeli]|eukprot:RNF00079.1 hypothetical protein TraAM80_07821 [Trypanosoma rangeli]